MSLRYIFGCSGSGKSHYIQNQIIKRAQEEPDRNFLILVPDQFTMQTQKDFVNLSPNKCIMNIDVLSFSRFSHRIFEEMGYDTRPILDDTGKSLVLRKLAGQLAPGLQILGKNLSKQGYIHEVKSSISEFMQYGIGRNELNTLIEHSKARGALYYKLKDLDAVYGAFLDYMEGKYITKEETLDIVCSKIEKSKVVRDSVVVFDGFTGFTPIQYRVLRKLLQNASEVIMTITIPNSIYPYKLQGEEDLFYLSRKTVADLSNICREEHIVIEDDIFMEDRAVRFNGNETLEHLERDIFRYPIKSQQLLEGDNSISIIECVNPKEEVRRIASKISELIREEDYLYKDISLICGDLAQYSDHIEEQFALYDIPVFIDKTNHITLNPFIEYIRSALQILINNFSYDTVFHFLRSGMADFTFDEVDELENYVIRFGIKGKKQYSNVFSKTTPDILKNPENFDRINELRQRFVDSLEPLMRKGGSVKDYVENLYDFLVMSKAEEKLNVYEDEFRESNQLAKAGEYAQIYSKTMDLLDQIISLLGDEEMTLKEFAEILEAGFAEIKVGTIPQNVDKVIVGDNQRSRLKQVKALFFLGVNDGYIPSKNGAGGLINDIDRDFLKETGIELSPGPRQQMYIQRYYLYLNLTKPSERLVLSYSKSGNDGKAVKPAYLISTLKQMYEGLSVETDVSFGRIRLAESPKQGLSELASGFRKIAAGVEEEEEIARIMTLLAIYREKGLYKEQIDELIHTAFKTYEHHPLSALLAKELYGKMIMNSVTRLEKFAACEYAHFLKYGLIIDDREAYEFNKKDIGSVAHNVLEAFTKRLEEAHIRWTEFDKITGETIIDQCVEDEAIKYNETILYNSARNEYAVKRLKRVMNRTVFTLQEQLRRGFFEPEKAELSFNQAQNLKAFDIALPKGESMRIGGRIDRLDVCREETAVYVKVIDYKTSNKQFDMNNLYNGLQMQLVVYMNAAMELEKQANPDKKVEPAALLYYNIADPVIEETNGLSEEELNKAILKELKMTGVVNSDEIIIRKLDSEFESKSDIIPVEYKKSDNSFSKNSKVRDTEELQVISDFVNKKIAQVGREILEGQIQINPCLGNKHDSCGYCEYKGICGFDENIKGFSKRKLAQLEDDEIMTKMREEIEDGN